MVVILTEEEWATVIAGLTVAKFALEKEPDSQSVVNEIRQVRIAILEQYRANR